MGACVGACVLYVGVLHTCTHIGDELDLEVSGSQTFKFLGTVKLQEFMGPTDLPFNDERLPRILHALLVLFNLNLTMVIPIVQTENQGARSLNHCTRSCL